MNEHFASSFVRANGIKTHFVHAGRGDPVVLVHGGGPGASGEHNWGKNIAALAQHFQVFAIDLIGYGHTDKPNIEYSYKAKVDHLAGFIDAMCLERTFLCGNSMGAYVATRYMLDHPERVKKLFMVASATVANGMGLGEPSRQGWTVRSAVGGTVTAETMRAWLGMLIHNKVNITDAIVDSRVRVALLPGSAEAQASYKRHIQRVKEDANLHQWYDLSHRLPRMTIPMALTWGKNDQFAPIELADRLVKALPNLTEYHPVEGSGHQVQNDQPEIFNRLITDFFLKG